MGKLPDEEFLHEESHIAKKVKIKLLPGQLTIRRKGFLRVVGLLQKMSNCKIAVLKFQELYRNVSIFLKSRNSYNIYQMRQRIAIMRNSSVKQEYLLTCVSAHR